jgi:hypothetical protein
MLNKESKKELDNSTLASVKKEMAKPRMAKSARIAERNLDTTRISERLANGPHARLTHKISWANVR